MPRLTLWLELEDAAQAQDAYDQMKARATNTTIVGLGTASERTSYARLTDDNGGLIDGFYVDTFGIVREGEYEPPPNTYPLWQTVTGGENAYPATNAAGEVARVEHNGRNWENTHGDGTTWEPGSAGIGDSIWLDLGEVGA